MSAKQGQVRLDRLYGLVGTGPQCAVHLLVEQDIVTLCRWDLGKVAPRDSEWGERRTLGGGLQANLLGWIRDKKGVQCGFWYCRKSKPLLPQKASSWR